MRRLNVWWDCRLVGELTQDRSGDLGFRYDPHWTKDRDAPALSVSLPKRASSFSRHECRPFFAGLLPDEQQRNAAAQALGVSEANDFALLDGLGGDVAGALQLIPADRAAPSPTYDAQTQPLTEADLVDVLESLPARPLLAGSNGLRLSLAGAQSKLPVVLVNGAISLPRQGQPTTHIIKPSIAAFPAFTENEAAVMRLAHAVGLDVAAVEPRIVADRTLLLVERYDRTLDAAGWTRRLHQEDFCQALGVPPNRKYASEGGPVFKDCFALVRQVSTNPGRDVLKLLDAAIFNVIVGNADAHGKNFSILYGRDGARLAPLYDLLSTVRYPGLASNAAMRIGRAADLSGLDDENWRRFAADAGLAIPFIRRRGRELAEKLHHLARSVCASLYEPGLDERSLSGLAEEIAGRSEIFALKLPGRSQIIRAPKTADSK